VSKNLSREEQRKQAGNRGTKSDQESEKESEEEIIRRKRTERRRRKIGSPESGATGKGQVGRGGVVSRIARRRV
jgi:hypothetical protein